MNRSQIVALANAIQAIRPDWQQAGIVAQLTILASGWVGSDAALFAHAATVAANPATQTPGAFNTTPPPRLTYTPQDRGEIEVRSQAIARCHLCDSEGRLPQGQLCYHDRPPDERARLAAAHADQARQALNEARRNRPNQEPA